MRLLRAVARICLFSLAWLAGCSLDWLHSGGGGPDGYYIPAYGMAGPPHDPTVVLEDFSYTPASPVHLGDELTFTIKLNHPLVDAYAARLSVQIGNPPQAGEWIWLKDNGQAPDEQARDGIYTESLTWTAEPDANTPVTAYLEWDDGAPGQQLSGLPLTILTAEE